MSVNIPQLANPKVVTTVLSTAPAADIYTASSSLRGILNSLSACNTSAASVKFSLAIMNGVSVVFQIYDEFPIAAHETLFMKDHEVPVFDGWSVRVQQDAAAEAIHVVAVIGEINNTRGTS